jgi:hypothetical protein
MTFTFASVLLLAGLSGLPPISAQDAAVEAPSNPSWNRVDYVIRASLDDKSKRLDGEETIRFTNNSGIATSELHFHLYLNAFSNDRSVFSLERGSAHGEGEWGWQRVTSITVGGEDVIGSLEFTQAKGGVAPEDRTAFRVTTPQPVLPGEVVEIAISWTSQLPRLRRRTGYNGDFLLVAQWFPKLGVFEGEKGWNCHPFHGSTEFFSDYGSYNVTLDLPAKYEGKVGATGVPLNTRIKDGDRVEVVFEAPSAADQERLDALGRVPLVHDFTWTADPEFVVKSYEFSYGEWAAKSPVHQEEVEAVQRALGPDVDLALRDIDITVFTHHDYKNQADRFFEATANTLFFYGLWFGEYPYEHITVVEPGWGNWGAGGMEYPMLFTSGTKLFSSVDRHRPEGLTIHECGHQFWQGMVGNNEVEAAWLDEGFNSYGDSEVLFRAYGNRTNATDYSRLSIDGVRAASLPDGGPLGGVLNGRRWKWDIEMLHDFPVINALSHHTIRPLRSSGLVNWWRDQPLSTLVPEWDDPRWEDRTRYLLDPRSGAIDHPSLHSSEHFSYRTNSYQRPAIALRSLIGVVGYDKFLAGMRNFAEKYRYGHPYGQEFYDAFNEGAQKDVTWYFDDAFRSTKTIDWKVAKVNQRRLGDPQGWFQGDDGAFHNSAKTEETSAEEGGGAEPVAEGEASDKAEADEQEESWQIAILLKREGELCLDLPVLVIFENGAQQEITWEREHQLAQSWLKIPFTSPDRVKAVVLDPDRLYYFDTDMSDNQWYAEGDQVAPLRWTEKVLNQYGHLLHWYAGIGG